MRKLLFSLLISLFISVPAYAQVGLFIRSSSSSLSSPVTGQTYLFNSSNYTISTWNGSNFQIISAAQGNYTATTAPTSANDNTQGYSVGSEWYNTTNGNVYTCVSAATSAAVWVQVNNLGSLSIPLTALLPGGAAPGQSLIFNGTNWAPGAPLVPLGNLLQTGAFIGQVPTWNGANWAASNVPAGPAGPLTVANESTSFTAAPGTLYLVTLGSADVTCTLPDATATPGAQFLVVLNTGSNVGHSLFFTTTGGQLINNSNFWYTTLGYDGGTAVTVNTFVSNGVGWNLSQGGDMFAALFHGTYNFLATTGTFVQAVAGNTFQLEPLFAPNTENSDFITFGQNSYFVDTSGGNVTCTLPDATSEAGQQIIVILSATGNHCSFLTTASQTINGAAPGSLTPLSAAIGSSYTFLSDGANWYVCASR